MTLLFAFLIGLFAGFRSATPPAAVVWAVHLGWLKLGSRMPQIGSLPFVILLSVLALAELIFDKLPFTPNRTTPPALIARIATGALTGPDYKVALVEDLVAIGGSLFIVSRF